MRLDKFLAHAQIGTRSEVKKLVRKKRVTCNGVVTVKSDLEIDTDHDVIMVDGEEVVYEAHLYIMLHKPQDCICATADPDQMTVMDLFEPPLPNDYFPVGRLDKDTSGLVLICNDGKLAHQLLSPRHHVDKLYEVHTAEAITSSQVAMLSADIQLKDVCYRGAKVEVRDTHCMWMRIAEGKFHQVKRMVAHCGNQVVSLKRLAMGPLTLDETLGEGEYRLLTDEELAQLRECGKGKRS